MNGIIGDIFIETALDQIINEAAEEFEDVELYGGDMDDIIDFLNPTESEDK